MITFCCMRGCVAFVEGKYTYSCLGSTTSLLVEQFCMFLSYQLALGLITMVRNFAESLTLTIAQRLSCRPYSASTLLNLNISLQLGSYSAPALLDLIIAPGSLNLIVRPYSWTLIVHPWTWSAPSHSYELEQFSARARFALMGSVYSSVASCAFLFLFYILFVSSFMTSQRTS